MKKRILEGLSINGFAALCIAGVLIGAMVICAGCVQSGNDDSTLRVVMNFGPDSSGSLDPANGWEGWYVREAGLFETLFYDDQNMELKPELATGYKALSDTEWEITLRKGVVFHDGTPFNADAVIYSFNRVLDPANSRSSEYSFIKEVRKTDDYTIVIETTEPYAPLIASLVDPVMSIISPNIVDVDKQPVGTGPYAFVSFESGASMDLVRNDKYWGGTPKAAKLSMTYNADATARTLMLKSGDVDIAKDILPSEYASLKSDSSTDVESKETLRAYFIYINGGKAPFDDVNVRQALSYALNRQEIVDTALEGVAGSPAVGMFTNTMPWNANDKIASYDNDQAKALELLAKAGITKGSDGKLYYNGEPFTIEIMTYTNRAALPASLEVIAAQYEKLGITVTTKHAEWSAIKSTVTSGTYDMVLYTWVTAPTGDPDYFISGHYLSTGAYASGWTHYSNPQMDEWILAARSTFDQTKRAELYDKIQEQAQIDCPIIYVFYAMENDAMSTSVKGFTIYPNDYTLVTKNIAVV
ncbi:4-phytase [Methanocorpusculum labreanum Z]|uniref:4-phytase n=1 Tax=Methanocorpusculum labreanum (strain ATCC 43576 / DSM 4855 / Z) TaxID=410358 RepID=A2SRD9_METLZ|nr:ABC transporter substrate-binding protein [Methanocorpusculum labreanum]ABN06895.1 4-phytase [Methanocorpusculum labreanum Z]